MTLAKSFAGREFNVIAPATMGVSGDTSCFDQHEPIMGELESLKPGALFVDIGAHFGAYTMAALALGADVWAFEPTQAASKVLRENIRVNGWGDRATVIPVAIYNGRPYPSALWADVFTKHYPSDGHPEAVLDAFQLAPAMVKIDVEGAELGVLEGAKQTLEMHHPTLLIEDHENVNPGCGDVVSDYPASIDSSRRIHEMLAELGYSVQAVRWDVSRRFLVAKHAA